jgi:hypothetical protein
VPKSGPKQEAMTMASDHARDDPPMHSATFHLDDGRTLVLTVVRAAASGFETGRHKTRLELFSADRVLLRRANLAPMLREEPW